MYKMSPVDDSFHFDNKKVAEELKIAEINFIEHYHERFQEYIQQENTRNEWMKVKKVRGQRNSLKGF